MDFLYRLKVVDRLLVEENWKEEDEAIIGRHFKHLQKLQSDNKLILAGKTKGLDKDTLGLVIFSADSKEEAEKIMNSDPAIKEEIMTGFLQEYVVALYKKS